MTIYFSCKSYEFHFSCGKFICDEYPDYTLEHDDEGHLYTMTTGDGTTWQFQDCDPQNDNPPGLFYAVYQANGGYTEVEQYSDDNIEEIVEYVPQDDNSESGDAARLGPRNLTLAARNATQMTYAPGAGGKPQVQQVSHTRNGQLLGQVAFSYHGGSDGFGLPGDLQGAHEELYVAGQTTHNDYHFRYDGQHGLKHFVGPQAFAQLQADGYDPATAADAVIARYADQSFQYDSQRRVCRRSPAGQTSSSYSYTDNPQNPYNGYEALPLSVEALNLWKEQIVELRSDGAQTITYNNCLGQTLLQDVQDALGNSAVSYYQYNIYQQQSLYAEPPAVIGYGLDGYGNLAVTLQPDSGTIHHYDYYDYTSADSGGGAVEGRLEDEWVQAGSDGAPVYVHGYTYSAYSVAGQTIYNLASESLLPERFGRWTCRAR